MLLVGVPWLMGSETPLLGYLAIVSGNGSSAAGSSQVAKGGPAAVRRSDVAGSGPTAIGSTIAVGIVRLAIL
jgi:hypothetical protein